MGEKLIFVYNAESGLGNVILDAVHKIFSPSTYECNLCKITYGAFTENKTWKKFREETLLEMEFLHKDEFINKYTLKEPSQFDYPVILTIVNTGLKIFMGTKELNGIRSAEDLMAMIRQRA